MSAIELQAVGVRFPRQRTRTLRERLRQVARGRFPRETVEALHDVSFRVERGETLGIVGSNGSGKSTLLRVIAGILTPSSGCCITRGPVAPIIELGAGFDFDLTGRENVYFNGALLGRSRREIRASLDAIVDFSGLGGFIDQPMRTYSTGMVARLAFSIVTRVEADIILLDEVLAVGDESFRERSRERIESIYGSGAAVVLVSHDLESIERLCHRAVWLDRGRIAASGDAREVVGRYYAAVAAAGDAPGVRGVRAPRG